MRNSKLADIVLFTMFGVIMFVSDVGLEFLPNIHGVALSIAVVTLVYRTKAIYSILVYIFLTALSSLILTGGYIVFWWLPYIYIFTILWLLVMLIPKSAPLKFKAGIAMGMCGFHGLIFGTLYAPYQAIVFGLNFQGMLTWIAAGLPADVIHMCGNIAMATLIAPLYKAITKLEANRNRKYQ